MSRCFPYPPPGLVKNEPLIQQQEPIKLQEEAEKAKKEKREKKREKNEQKKRKRESELLDRRTISTLTEEHPIGSQNSSDSTLNSNNSNKRPKQNLSPECRQNSGNILRIRLPLQRHKDQDVLPSEELPSQLPPSRSNNAPMEQPPARLPLRDPVSSELPIKETQPSRLPIQSNKVEKPFRLPIQRTNAPQVPLKEKLPSQLSLQTNKECRLPVQKAKVLPKDEQSSRLPLKTRTESTLPPQDKHTSLKRTLEQEALLKEKKTCLVSLQGSKNPDASHRERQQPSQLPPQTNREPKCVVPIEKKPSQLPIRTNNDQKVIAKEKKFSELPLPANKDRKVEDKGKQPCQLPLQRNDSAASSKQEQPTRLLSQKPVVQPVMEKQLCAVSGRTADATVQERSKPAEKGERPSTSKGEESKEEKKSRRKASAYKELFEKWTEPPHFMSLLPTDVDDDDDGWLCKMNSSLNCGVGKPAAAVDSLRCCGDSASWPRARPLPSVDIHALPYTVPF